MAFSTAAKETMLDALTADRIQLHDGDPGAAGTSNVVTDAGAGSTMVAATFGAASSGERTLSTDVDYTGLTAAQSVTYISVWDYNTGSPVYHGSAALTGDTTANASGEFTVKATTTKLSISDS